MIWTGEQCSQGALKYWEKGNSVKFNFTGTKFRYISIGSNNRPTAVSVKLDGIEIGPINFYVDFVGLLYQYVQIARINLDPGEHSLEVIYPIDSDGNFCSLDAIDLGVGEELKTFVEIINSGRKYVTNNMYYVHTTETNSLAFGNISQLTSVTATTDEPTGTTLRWLVSFDGGTTWKYDSGGSWVEASGGFADIGDTW
ncbi:MAG: hypothetical protein OMM_06088 [Candidatus Magnetoglobus multicellularis str. Araruama]|uniref:Uncharacterized protein n=1 Tax=Candidatus Magnetoglobus multicellularis str. Araruama TaxID=890399 RepID=A0A1V1NRV9_9BACT|nr:MAG: hypothetical protein OMM_06088 [Candidatus Magnetoglobus multicellularis str. Araruama]